MNPQMLLIFRNPKANNLTYGLDDKGSKIDTIEVFEKLLPFYLEGNFFKITKSRMGNPIVYNFEQKTMMFCVISTIYILFIYATEFLIPPTILSKEK